VVIAFRGSSNLVNYESDLLNSGGSAWEAIKPVFQQALAQVQKDYPGYQIMTDGGSLGGGMAQTAALEFNLSGYGQNSMPISSMAAADSEIQSQGGVTQAISNWSAAGNTFSETNVQNDPATFLYSTIEKQTYLDTNPTTLTAPASVSPTSNSLVGILSAIAQTAWQDHTGGTVVNLLSAQQNSTSNSGSTSNSSSTSTSSTSSSPVTQLVQAMAAYAPSVAAHITPVLTGVENVLAHLAAALH
jgi:hypothetical protein